MTYHPPKDENGDLIALCHMIKAEDSRHAARAAATFLAQAFDCEQAAIFRMNKAGNALVLWGAVELGDSHFAPEALNLPITHSTGGLAEPISYTVLSGKGLKLNAPFVGFDLSYLSKIFRFEAVNKIETIRFFDRREKLAGVALLIRSHPEPRERYGDAIQALLVEIVGLLLGNHAELSEAEEKIANISAVFEQETMARKNLQARMQNETGYIIGESAPVKKLRREIERTARFNTPIMLIGNEGVGRRASAREIHDLSTRSNGPFRVLDMKRLNDANLHPELLGYKRGAIDGMASARRGVLADVSGGTLFLKNFEVATRAAQELILQVLEQGAIRPLGSESDRKVDIRFITGVSSDGYSNWQDLDLLPTLFHKLATNIVLVPSLDEIREDLRHIIYVEIERLNRAHYRDVAFTEDAVLYLSQRDYSGNLAELRSLIERLHHNSGENDSVTAADIQNLLSPAPITENNTNRLDGLREQVREFERVLILNALTEADGSRAEAALKLKLPKRTLAEKCKNFGL